MSIYLVKQSIHPPVIYVLIALILLSISFKVWMLYFNGQSSILVIMMLAHCVMWMIAGRMLKQIYFVISGIAGILITLYFLFF